MMQAYEGHVLNAVPEVKTSQELKEPMRHEVNMRQVIWQSSFSSPISVQSSFSNYQWGFNR